MLSADSTLVARVGPHDSESNGVKRGVLCASSLGLNAPTGRQPGGRRARAALSPRRRRLQHPVQGQNILKMILELANAHITYLTSRLSFQSSMNSVHLLGRRKKSPNNGRGALGVEGGEGALLKPAARRNVLLTILLVLFRALGCLGLFGGRRLLLACTRQQGSTLCLVCGSAYQGERFWVLDSMCAAI